MKIARGRLLDVDATPEHGERFEALAQIRNVLVEQILSSSDENPECYVQPQDEWVIVLDGAATLDVDGELVELGPRDWVVLPAGVPHRVVATAPQTNWLAVHVHPPDS
jgi:cupin 2 domain-containing protein